MGKNNNTVFYSKILLNVHFISSIALLIQQKRAVAFTSLKCILNQ